MLIVFAFVWFAVSTIRLNEERVTVQFAFFQPLVLELWMVMLAAFGIGAGVILFFDLAGGVRRFARDRRRRRVYEAHQAVEELYTAGLDALVNGHHEKALQRFDSVLEREPEHEHALVKKGDSLRALKRYREAADTLERTTRVAPKNLVAHYSLVDVYLAAGAEERAKIVLEQIIEGWPVPTVSAHRKLRDLLVEHQKWEEASVLQSRLVDMVSSDEERALERDMAKGLRLGLGVAQLSAGRSQEAIAAFRLILGEDESFVPAYIRLGEALAANDETEEAIRTWHRGHELTGSTELLSSLQNFYLRAEQPEEAIGVWKQALVLSENEVPLRYCLGKLHYRLFMLDEALREFQMIEDRVSGLPALHLYMARILESKNELSAALKKTKLLVAEVEGLMMDYACESCAWRMSEWTERCARCGRWGTVSLHLPTVDTPEPVIAPSPTWSTP
jgi:tetratricopeptide (TPR) repeat protein